MKTSAKGFLFFLKEIKNSYYNKNDKVERMIPLKKTVEEIQQNGFVTIENQRFLNEEDAILLCKRVAELEENLNEIHEIVNDFYTEGKEVKRLPKHLTRIANELSLISRMSKIEKPEQYKVIRPIFEDGEIIVQVGEILTLHPDSMHLMKGDTVICHVLSYTFDHQCEKVNP